MSNNLRKETIELYLIYIQKHANGIPIKQIAQEGFVTTGSIRHAFFDLRKHYGAVSTENLIAILFRLKKLK